MELRRQLWPSRGIVCPSRPQTIFFSSKSKLASRWQNALAVAGLRLHRGRLLKNVGGSRKNAAGAGLKATVLQWIATAWRVLESLWKRSLCTSTSSHLLGSAKRQTQPSLSSHCWSSCLRCHLNREYKDTITDTKGSQRGSLCTLYHQPTKKRKHCQRHNGSEG